MTAGICQQKDRVSNLIRDAVGISVTRAVWRRAIAGTPAVFRLLSLFTLLAFLAATATASTAFSLAGQRKALQVFQVQSSQANRRLEVFLVSFEFRVAVGLRFLSQQSVVLA